MTNQWFLVRIGLRSARPPTTMTPMVWSNLTWMLTGLAAVLVLLTRVRLRVSDGRAAGVTDVSGALLTWHTSVGVMALALWITALSTDSGMLESLALLAWWILTVVGLMLLARWLPAHGRHADDTATDEWGSAGLSLLGHLGMFVGAVYFTFVAVTGRL